jgi:outer membrane protein assembly factor BamB
MGHLIRGPHAAFLGVVALMLALVACGGDSEDESQPSETAEETTEEALPEAIPVEDAKTVDLDQVAIREIKITDGPDWMVEAFNSLWVKRDDGALYRIDPSNGKVLAEISGGPFKEPVCQGIGASDDAVWTCPVEGEVVRIDPQSNEVVATVKVDKLLDQGRLVSAEDQVWVVTDGGNALTGIDVATQKPATTIELPGTCADLAASGSTLWVTCPQEDLLLRVDAAAGEVSDQLELPGAQNASVGDDVFVGYEGGVAQVDPETLEVAAVYGVYPRLGGSIFATPEAVWVREEGGDRFLTQIDPSAQEFVQVIEAPRIPSGGDVTVAGGSVWATAYEDDVLVQLPGGE